jgi:hypothetical protein
MTMSHLLNKTVNPVSFRSFLWPVAGGMFGVAQAVAVWPTGERDAIATTAV